MFEPLDNVHWLSSDDIFYKVTLSWPDCPRKMTLRLVCRSINDVRDFVAQFYPDASIFKIIAL
jgi:hypothetical protein